MAFPNGRRCGVTCSLEKSSTPPGSGTAPSTNIARRAKPATTSPAHSSRQTNIYSIRTRRPVLLHARPRSDELLFFVFESGKHVGHGGLNLQHVVADTLPFLRRKRGQHHQQAAQRGADIVGVIHHADGFSSKGHQFSSNDGWIVHI